MKIAGEPEPDNMTRYLLLLILLLRFVPLKAQDYHAIQGSPLAGSLGVHDNPASIVITPYKCDITLLSMLGKNSTKLFIIYNYTLLSNPYNSRYYFDGGSYKRYANLQVNINLLNARIALGRNASIAFGANVKSYSNLSSSSYNFIDTLHSSGDFFKINRSDGIYSATLNSSTWAEIYGSYARTIFDNYAARVNAGITLKVNKGLSGAAAKLENGRYDQVGDNRYNISTGFLQYYYSANYDHWKKSAPASTNINNLFKYALGGISLDAGFEYIIKPQEISDRYDEDNYYDYDWKIGVSLLDVGFTRYRAGNESRAVSNVKSGITNVNLDQAFDSTVTSLRIFNDSLSTLVDNFNVISGGYRIVNPMRLVLNVDHFITKNIFINAEVSVNVIGSWLKNWNNVKSMNLLTVTPRWETRKFGIYMPIQFTGSNQFCVGGAFRAGPLLIGIHNWANLFTYNSVQNGGGYIAFIIRNPENIGKKHDKRLDCPSF